MDASGLHYACDRFGIAPSTLEHLGKGHFGDAWKTPRGSVLKVTTDPSEIELIELGVSHRLRGLPVVWQGPIVCNGRTFAYERESLDGLSFFDRSLGPLSFAIKPNGETTWQNRLRLYDQTIQSPEVEQKFPLVAEALQKLRQHGRAVWDLKKSNLGLRGDDVVIRDGRCVRFDARYP